MKLQTLFDYFPITVRVSLNGSQIYTTNADVLKPYLEYDVKNFCPLVKGRTAYLGITTKREINPEELKLKFL
jgi:hypothetical protein